MRRAYSASVHTRPSGAVTRTSDMPWVMNSVALARAPSSVARVTRTGMPLLSAVMMNGTISPLLVAKHGAAAGPDQARSTASNFKLRHYPEELARAGGGA